MELRPVTKDDLPLYEAIYCDPAMMQHLGGPLPRENVPRILDNVLRSIDRGEAWAFKILLGNESDQVAGNISLWQHDEGVERINEIGWTVLPAFQGRGIATKALHAVLDMARTRQRFSVIHAYPGIDNAASNALCHRAGFELLGAEDVHYANTILRCNHWRIDLRDSKP